MSRMLYGPDGRPLVIPVVAEPTPPPPRGKMGKCRFCKRRRREGEKCCSAVYTRLAGFVSLGGQGGQRA